MRSVALIFSLAIGMIGSMAVHSAHENAALGLAGVGMRLLLPPIGAVLGLAGQCVGTAGDDDCTAQGGRGGFVAGMIGATLIDSLAFGRTIPRAQRQRRAHARDALRGRLLGLAVDARVAWSSRHRVRQLGAACARAGARRRGRHRWLLRRERQREAGHQGGRALGALRRTLLVAAIDIGAMSFETTEPAPGTALVAPFVAPAEDGFIAGLTGTL